MVPGEIQKNGNPQFANSFDYDDSTRSWAQIYRDVDLTYGSVRGTPNDNSTVISYKRILRAEFLKYLDAPATAAEVSQVDGETGSGGEYRQIIIFSKYSSIKIALWRRSGFTSGGNRKNL